MKNNILRVRRAAFEIGVFSFVVNALLLVMPLYLLQIYDRVLPSSSTDTLVFLSIMAVGALVLLAILETVRGIYASRLAARLDISRSRGAIMASMDSPKAGLGDIQPLRDLTAVCRFLSARTIFALFDLPFAPLFIALLWLIHPFLFVLTALGAVALAAVANQRATSAVYREAGEEGAKAMITAQSFVRNAETLRAMGMVGNAIDAWAGYHVPTLDAQDRAGRINAIFTGISRFMRMGLQIAVLGFGAWFVLNGEMTAGMIFASSIISGRGLQPIDQVIGGWPQFVEARAAWTRLKAATNAAADEREVTSLPDPVGRLDVENLVYFAPNTTGQTDPILKRLSFRVPAGSITGIIGPSGAGKSTLARLIVGAIRPSAGVIRMDGADIRNWDPNVLGQHIGYLSQEVELLPGTITQNISRFSREVDDEAVVEAAQRAQVHELILGLPEAYDTLIGPQGMMLSGGQRQRIGLARAFFGNPRFLVLDEPNANLDNDGELALERALDEARTNDTTVLIITQRRSIAGKVDNLMVLRGGLIEDYGSRDEVIVRQQEKNQAAAQQAAPATGAVQGPLKKAANVNNGAAEGGVRDDRGNASSKSPFAGYGPGMRPVTGNETKN